MKGWQIRRLGDFCTIASGGTPAKGNPSFWVGDVPFVSARDLKSDRIETAFLHISRDAVEQSATRIALAGSLLMLVRGMGLAHGIQIGEVVAPVAFNQDLRSIRPSPGLAIPRFLLLGLRNIFANSEGARAMSAAAHGTLKIDSDILQSLMIPLPPLGEQRRLVSLLDESLEGLAAAKVFAEKNLQNARALFESHLQSTFTQRGPGWIPTTLGEEVDLLVGFAFKSDKYSTNATDIRLLRGDNIIQSEIRWDDAKRWPANSAKEYNRYFLREGDVVLAMDRPWVKAGLKHATISAEDLPCLLVQRTARLRGRGGLDGRFLKLLVGSAAFTRHILGVQTGIGVPHISGQQIKDFEFARPPITEQLRVAAELEAIYEETQRLARICEQKLAALDALKKSLLHQAFSGNL